MLQHHEELFPSYVAAWRPVLVGWLRWPRERFDAWIRGWDRAIRGTDHHREWFYHEGEMYYVAPLLVPDELALRLAGLEVPGREPFDGRQVLYQDLAGAVCGEPQRSDYGQKSFDWTAAMLRVERVLAGYGASFPPTEQVTDYERSVTGDPA